MYAREDGKPSTRDERDRGFVSRQFNLWAAESYQEFNVAIQHSTHVAILTLFISLNVLMPFVLWRMAIVYYTFRRKTRKKPDYTGLIFWSSSFSASLINAWYLEVSVGNYKNLYAPKITKCIITVHGSPCDIPNDTALYKDAVTAFIAKAIVVPFALILELAIAIFVLKTSEFPKPPCVIMMLLNCFHSSWKSFLIKAVQTLALYQILLFVQILTVLVIPVCVLFFVSPPHTILLVSTVMFIAIAFTVVISYCLHICEHLTIALSWSKYLKTCGSILVRLTVLTASFTLVVAALSLYGFLLYAKIDMTGVQGLVFSILPSFLLSVIGWIIKKKLCTERLHHGTDEEGQQQAGRSHSEGGTVAEMQSMLQEHEQTA